MKFKILLISVACSALYGCGDKDNISARIAEAEMAMAAEDVAGTRNICDNIMNEHDARGGITATELARLSILYMQLNERTDDPGAIELATECYRSAFRQNADSAKAFYTSLPVEDDKYIMTLSSIVSSIDYRQDISEYKDNYVSPDSVGIIEDDTAHVE